MIELSNLKTLFNKSSDVAIYCLTVGDTGTQAIVYIPHFSEHTITVEKMVDPDYSDHSEDNIFGIMAIIVMIAGIITVLLLTINVLRLGRYKQ